ncbi:TPA: hypothetical protein ACFRHA_000482 [Neisseria subflava]
MDVSPAKTIKQAKHPKDKPARQYTLQNCAEQYFYKALNRYRRPYAAASVFHFISARKP